MAASEISVSFIMKAFEDDDFLWQPQMDGEKNWTFVEVNRWERVESGFDNLRNLHKSTARVPSAWYFCQLVNS